MSIYRSDPAAPGATTRRRQAAAVTGDLEGAAARFNASEAARVVSGLTRSLGRPRASVGAAAGAPSRVRVTVAWELCWYQWSVDLAEGGVREIGKGEAVGQLDRAARQWNAAVGRDGRLAFGAAGRRRAGWLRRR